MVEFQGKVLWLTLNSVNRFELSIHNFSPISGSSCIDLRELIKNMKAVINFQNNDQKCFMWAIKSALYTLNIYLKISYKI